LKRLVIVLGFCAAGLSAHADRAWLPPEQFDQLHLVVSADAPEPEQIAARRFAEHWRLTTGFEPAQSSEAVAGAVNVWIGSAAQRAFPAEFEKRRPSADGGFVLTLPRGAAKPGGARDLILAGGGPRGTLAAEWTFFERFLGARVFAPGVMRFPKPEGGIPHVDYRYEPPFEYRDTNYRVFLENPWFASLNTLNGQWTNVPERLGGHIGFVHGLPGFGHTFHDFVNPDEYFDSHPEYFAEINGERVKYSQLCLTNPDVLAITIERARRYLREAAPDERILSISQMDYYWFDSWCACPRCRAVDEAEGSHSGTILRFVNAVAAAIEDEFPDARVDTFAYLYSRKPPKLTRPRGNVLIRLCAIEADYSRPLADRRSPANRAFVRDLEEWRRIAKHLYVWDYTQNWRAFQAPHPNMPVLQPNLALFQRVGVDGVFEQASPFSPHSDFELLKGYLLGRGLRDPGFDWKKEVPAFLEAYYGEAAPYIAEYQRLLQDRLHAWRGPLHFVNDLEWLDAETVERAQDIFARSFAAVRDEILRERLRSAYLPVQYAALVCPPRVYQGPDAYVFTRPAGPTFDEYYAAATALGVTHLNDYPLDALKTRLKGQTPPRYEIAPIEKLRNDRFEVWTVPARGGAVVRWRERATGRDWLAGFDDIRSSEGRLQVWATANEDRWAEPEPIAEAYTVVERREGAITLETRLDNGLVLRKRMELIGDGLETRLSLQNSSAKAVVPKVTVVAEMTTGDLERPSVWTQDVGGRASSRAEFSGAHGSRGRSPSHREIALRFPSVGRTIIAEIAEGGPGDSVKFDHAPGSRFTRLVAEADRAPLAPGEGRTLIVRHRISEERPGRSPGSPRS
jgi:hypothetical protein